MQTLRFFNPKMILLLVVAFAVVFMWNSTSRLWNLDHDAGGLYPASDCGHSYTLQLIIPGQKCANLTRKNAQPIEDQAADEMRADHETQFADWEDALDTLRDYIGGVLERLYTAW